MEEPSYHHSKRYSICKTMVEDGGEKGGMEKGNRREERIRRAVTEDKFVLEPWGEMA